MRYLAVLLLLPMTVTAQQLKPLPRFDWKMAALAGLDTGIAAWDIHQTLSCVHAGTCVERNPVFGPRPSGARIVGLTLAIDAGWFVAGYEWRRHAPAPLRRFWWVAPGNAIESHVWGIATSQRGKR